MKKIFLLAIMSLTLKADAEPSIFIMGDSTSAKYGGTMLPRTGWGVGLEELVRPEIKIENFARAGRSTKSYIAEGIWDLLKRRVQEGDYVFIQFGHNDGKKDIERLSAPAAGLYKENLIMFVSELKKLEVNPILVTPVSRCTFKDGKIYNSLGDYPMAMRQVAEETQTPLIDINSISMSKLNEMGEKEAHKLFMFLDKGESPNYPDGISDGTHFCQEGALQVAVWVSEECRRQNLPVSDLFRNK
jgi:lysophospholipase L1-like esterase